MIKVSVMYPNQEGARFDHDYYRDQHMPMVQSLLGDYCKGYTVDKGLGGATPGSLPTYVGMCHIFFESLDAFEAGMAPHAERFNADIINYTDLIPEVQISEVRASQLG